MEDGKEGSAADKKDSSNCQPQHATIDGLTGSLEAILLVFFITVLRQDRINPRHERHETRLDTGNVLLLRHVVEVHVRVADLNGNRPFQHESGKPPAARTVYAHFVLPVCFGKIRHFSFPVLW